MKPTQAPADSKVLLQCASTFQQHMIVLLRDWVELESPSFDKAAVDRFGEAVVEEFSARGGRIHLHHTQRFGNHIQIDFPGKGAPILLLGHIDTVWELGTLAGMPFRHSKGRLWGPGVLDMKAGIVQMLFALESLKQVSGGVPRSVTILLVSDEEVGSESSRAITEKLAKRSSAVLVLEPSYGPNGALKTARKGVGDYFVKVTGRAAHAGLDFEAGQNAIVELSRQIARIERFTEFRRGLTVSPGIIRGGTRTNVVPAEAQVEVDVRIRRMTDAARIDRKFRRLKPFNRQCRLEVTGGINRPPMERTRGVAALFKKARKLGAELGLKLHEVEVGGGSDGNFTAALGVPTLDGLGAVGEGAHAVNESIVVSELAPRTALLARLIATL